MTAFDAAVLLVADGLVAVGRVLGGLRARCAAEKHADALAGADALAEAEAASEVWENGELFNGLPIAPLLDALDTKNRALVTEIARDFYGSPPVSECPHDSLHGIPGASDWYCNSCGAAIPQIAPQRSAAVSTPAADNTTDTKSFKTYDSVDVDHLEAAYNYHKLAAGWSTDKRTMWFCEGCDWTGPTPQAHARHRFQVLADMKNATHRIQEQLGGAP